MDDSEYQDHYEEKGNSPDYWELSAGDLISAANYLREIQHNAENALFRQRFTNGIFESKAGKKIPPELRLLKPELMLRGLSIECLLKAIWVKNGNTIVHNGRYIGVNGAGDHDLVQLFRVIGIPFTETEKNCLVRLSAYIIYAGRYPIPTRWEQTKATRINIPFFTGSPKWPTTTWISNIDNPTVDSMIERLVAQLRQ